MEGWGWGWRGDLEGWEWEFGGMGITTKTTRRFWDNAGTIRKFWDKYIKFSQSPHIYTTRVENTVGKGEIARYEQFLLFPLCFQKTYTADT